MTEYAASPSCTKLRMQRNCAKETYIPQSSRLRMARRRSSYGSLNVLWRSTWKLCKVSVSNLKVSPSLRETSFRSSCLGSLVDLDGMTASDWVPIGDQVLLTASIFLTYIAGVVPVQKSGFSSRKDISDEIVVLESSTSSGSAQENDHKVNSTYAWDVVKGKLLDSLDANEHESSLGSRVLEREEHQAKPPLSLYAISEFPKLWLLWACFQQLEEEVNNVTISDTVNMDDWMTFFLKLFENPVSQHAWLG